MKVLPLFYLGTLTDDMVEQHSCSDRLWLPRDAFDRYMLAADTDSVVTLRLKNVAEQVAVGAVYEVHSGDNDVIFAPLWMYEALEANTENVEVERFFPLLGTSITILPHSSDYLAMGDDPQETLKEGFEQYTCLTVGQDYKIWLGAFSFTITLQDVTPAETGVICIRNRELGLHILPPLDAPWPMPPVAAAEVSAAEVSAAEVSAAVAASTAAATTEETSTETPEERRRRIAEATRRRLGLSPRGDTS